MRRAFPNKYELYTLCVQAPERLAAFLAAVHGGLPRSLREDFAGPAAVCGAWVEQSPDATATAVDFDPEPLSFAPQDPRVRKVVADVMKSRAKADVIAALNFPIGYWHTRAELVAYFRHARACLKRGGVLVFDMYGGSDAWEPSVAKARFRTDSGKRVVYEWEQIEANPLTGLVHNAIHFTVEGAKRGAAPRRIRGAFEYHWRLWSIPELREALEDAGFARVEVYSRLGEAMDSDGRLYVRPMDDHDVLDADWVVYVAGRVR